MDFLPDTDQQALADATRDFIVHRFPLNDCPVLLDDVHWKEIAELGWLGLATDEDAGGAGATLVDEAFVFREVGRGLVPGPILTTLAAARLAAWTGDSALAAELIGGRTRVARAVPATAAGDRLLITDAPGSALTLIVDEASAALYATPIDLELSPGLEDGTVLGRVRTDDLGTPVLGTEDAEIVARLRRVLSILTSAQLAGITGATRDLATEYAKDRVQFGKPIGAFQAIKHRCADMAVNALAAENVMFFAALAETTTMAGSEFHVLAAAAFCRRAAFANVRANVQIHGALGFTVEDSAHRFVKRTHALCSVEGFGRAATRLGTLAHPNASEEL
jgi:alkylation response protein AidB-like acyl-CoA dehydrogenase